MERDFDVFLSHNSKDKSTVRKLAILLKERSLRVWLDEWELLPGRPWQEEIENMIGHAHSVAVLVGSEGIGPWQQAETRAFLSEFVNRGLPVIPVLLPGAPSRVDLPLFLQNFTWVDFRNGFSKERINRLVGGITGTMPGKSTAEQRRDVPTYKTSTVRPKLEDIFQTVGLPRFTYVEPNIYRKFSHTIRIPGMHIVLEGPSGVGKTCLVFRVFEELGYERDVDYVYISARERGSNERILSILSSASSLEQSYLIVIDDVHILEFDIRCQLADKLKLLSDSVFAIQKTTKCVLIGIPTASAGLLFNALDLGPRLATFKLGRATNRQLKALIREGEERLAVRFRDRDVIVEESNGSFYLCQYICHEICFAENILEAQDDSVVLRYRIEDVRDELVQELDDRYSQHMLRFCKGEIGKVGKNSGYVALLASIARINKSVIHLNEILIISGPYSSAISKILGTMQQVLKETDDAPALSRLIHYDDSIETFSIEDPAFRYYLNKLDIRGILEILGLHDDDFIAHFRVEPPVTQTELKPNKFEPVQDEKLKEGRDLVFVSYSHADAKWMDRLRVHLMPLVKEGGISIWSDTQIRAGSNWMEEIGRAIDTTKVAVLLVSANYLASDFILSEEMPQLLQKESRKDMTIIWILISHCNWKETPIAQYQPAHDPSKPLAMLSSAEREKIFAEVSKVIKNAL